jgi:hypothetical protein
MDALVEKFAEVTVQNNFSIFKELHDMNNKVSLISVKITPSNCCKSSTEQNAKFTRLNEALGIDISYNLESCVHKLNDVDARDILKDSEPVILVAGSGTPTFSFDWVIPKVS